MNEHPILFSAPMVRALLDGKKTQTRRAIKPQPPEGWQPHVGWGAPTVLDKHGNECPGPDEWGAGDEDFWKRFPYGKPGDRLWVKEAWRTSRSMDSLTPKRIGEAAVEAGYKHPWAPMIYLADGRIVSGEVLLKEGTGRYRHPRFMPRWASRITREITEVRVQRLRDISEEDAAAEGISTSVVDPSPRGIAPIYPKQYGSNFDVYRDIWESINGAGSWDANPWVWALTFKAVQPCV